MFIAIPVAFMVIMMSLTDAYFKHLEQKQTNLIQDASKQGWTHTEQYAMSALSGFYSSGKFPVEVSQKKREGNNVILNFKLINNAADWLQVI